MNKTIILISIMALVIGVLAPMVSAQAFTYTSPVCINTTHLNTSVIFTLNGANETIINPPIYCPNGCEDNIGRYGADCKGTTTDSTGLIGVVVAYAFIAFAFLYSGFKLDKEGLFTGYLRTLFVSIGLFFSLSLAFVILAEAEQGGSGITYLLEPAQGVFTALSYVILFYIGYLVIVLIWNVFRKNIKSIGGTADEEEDV